MNGNDIAFPTGIIVTEFTFMFLPVCSLITETVRLTMIRKYTDSSQQRYYKQTVSKICL